jgi:BirA family biotin operon repressor/biotin-[acetyl-CoA-carboxylase] ligase
VPLNQETIEAALKAGRQSAYLPFSLHLFETVSSTNQIVWDLLGSGSEPGCVAIATQQTSGRGQWGRQWVSQEGGLYLSVAIAPNIEASNSYQLTLATAWGIAQQLQSCGIPLGIKWPNDLVCKSDENGYKYKKLGGILTETKVQTGKISQAVIGVGINWANPVPETGINLETWQANQQPKPIPSLEMLTSTILLGIESGIQSLFQEGINILLSRYLEFLINIGEEIYVNDVMSTIVGVTHTGDLRVCVETSKQRKIMQSEIHLQPGTISLGYRKLRLTTHNTTITNEAAQ